MQQEIEVKFLDVNHDALREKLTTAGAICTHPMRLMKRAIVDYPDRRNQVGNDDFWSWIRVRDEGDHIALTYKQVAKNEVLTTHEIEEEVSSYEKTIAIFEAVGLKKHAEQHTKRETWELDGCEVVLDEWPWLPKIIEIEGLDEPALQAVATRLDLDWGDIIRGNAEDMYKMTYPGIREDESISEVAELTFETMPSWLKERQ